MNRRQFLKSAGMTAGALAVAPAVVLEAEKVALYRADKKYVMGIDTATGEDFTVVMKYRQPGISTSIAYRYIYRNKVVDKAQDMRYFESMTTLRHNGSTFTPAAQTPRQGNPATARGGSQ